MNKGTFRAPRWDRELLLIQSASAHGHGHQYRPRRL